MTAEKLKIQYPEVYAKIFTAGIAQERDRVSAFMVFADVDFIEAKNHILAGNHLSKEILSNLSIKAAQKQGAYNAFVSTVKKELEQRF